MRIYGIKPYLLTSFKAHYYDCSLEREILNVNKIITDNTPNLGNNPELIITDGCGYEDFRMVDLSEAKPIPMKEIEPNHFIANAHPFINKYKISYKDTGLVDDNNGKNYDISQETLDKFTTNAIVASKKSHNHPLTSIISAGEVSGKLVICDRISELPENFDTETPTILLSKLSKDYNPYALPKNVVGIVLEKGSAGSLYHLNTELRNMLYAVAITYDKKEIEELETLSNQYVNFSTLNKRITVNKIDKPEFITKTNPVVVKIPEMQYIDTLVDSKDYELNTVGPKAYKLKIMENLVDKGVLEGVQIPRSFAVTHGFIDKILDSMRGTDRRYPPSNSPYFKEIENKIRELGLDENSLMFRSSFNGEDVENYSAAGLYKSFQGSIDTLKYYITDIARSKDTAKAVSSRRTYGIPDEVIKPTVIIQEAISPDYAFTIYTKDPTESEDILTINMNTLETSESRDPYILQYNKKDKTLKIQSIERDVEYFRFDERGKIISSFCPEDKLVKSWDEIKPTLETVVKNALKLEKYFGVAQDIEGGIKGDNIYFWQTRNIVKTLKNKHF